MSSFYIWKIINEKAYNLQDLTDHVRCAAVADIQLLISAEYIVSMLPDIKAFGLVCKHINVPSLMPDLRLQDKDHSYVQKLNKHLNAIKHRYNLWPWNTNHK